MVVILFARESRYKMIVFIVNTTRLDYTYERKGITFVVGIKIIWPVEQGV